MKFPRYYIITPAGCSAFIACATSGWPLDNEVLHEIMTEAVELHIIKIVEHYLGVGYPFGVFPRAWMSHIKIALKQSWLRKLTRAEEVIYTLRGDL